MRPSKCDASRLDPLLDGALTEQQECELLLHLDGCPSCGAELERRAASLDRWNDARELLADTSAKRSETESTTRDGTSLPLPVRQVLDSLAPTDDPKSLGRVDGYEILGVVGCGAMGVVLKALDRPLDRVVALKVMSPSLAVCVAARRRFAREAKAAAAIHHPNVITIHGVSTDHTLPYLVMPYVKGVSLQQRIDSEGPLALEEVLRLGSQVAAGLAAAHRQGLIHRDIKPSNIMLDEGVEAAVITDFGLARTIDDATMTRTGVITGTPEFMSPEQARGDSIGFTSDLFSLGSVLYQLCTGRPPFRAQTPFGVLRRITDDRPRPIRETNPEIPAWACRLIDSLHAKSPDARPSAEEAHRLLERCLSHVYQPDRVELPDQLTDLARRGAATRFRALKIGVLAVTALSLIVLSVPSLLAVAENDARNATAPASNAAAESAEAPDVFQTLNLDFPRPGEPGSVVIDITRGFIEVTPHDNPGVVIEVLHPPTERDATADGLRQQFAPQFDLETDPATNRITLDTYNNTYVLNLRVRVPARTDLSLDTYSDGYLHVTGVEGTVATHSQNCDIDLLEICGSATVFTYNGDVTVAFRTVADDAELDFETYNGSIDLTLPAGIRATTGIAAGRGSYSSAFDIAPIDAASDPRAAALERHSPNTYRFGRINGGGLPLRIGSQKGEITLRKRSD